MKEKAQVQSVALFYYFMFLDENKAKAATIRTLNICRRRIAKSEVLPSEVPSVVVNVTNQFWNSITKGLSIKKDKSSFDVGWLLPNSIDLGPWREFSKNSELENVLAVLWSNILNITDEQIAKGLGVTEGTVRYRVSRGLRELGKIQQLRGAD